jgi:hypothetical protein
MGLFPWFSPHFFIRLQDHGDSTTDVFLFAVKVFFRSVVYNAFAAALSYGDRIYQQAKSFLYDFCFFWTLRIHHL